MATKIEITKFQIAWALHVILTSFALMAWGNGGYSFVNIIFQGSLFFIYLQPKNVEALVICALINVFCLIFECVSIGIFWPGEYSPHSTMFSAVMAIINLAARVFTTIVLYLDYKNLKGKPTSAPQVVVN